ncbi:MAG: sigma-70 family RNA polymerase sigma factor, partial [Candidatus Limnocylindria bacterium]
MTYRTARDGTDPDDDATLVRGVAAGSQDALAALYDRFADRIFAAARRLTNDRQVAEEVVQETFLALWNRAELFDQRAGSLAAWLHAIARNRAIDRLRAAGRRPDLVAAAAAAGDDEYDSAALERLAAAGPVVAGSDPPPGPESVAESAFVRSVIQRALAEMPEPERTVIVLAYAEELSQSEIARRLGWPLGTVKTRTRRAFARLREVLAPELDEQPRMVRAGTSDGG